MNDRELLHILTEVADKNGLALVDMFAVTRSKAVTDARAEFFYRALAETTASSVRIGKLIGRDHSTALYGAVKYASRHGLPIPRNHSARIVTRHDHGQQEMV